MWRLLTCNRVAVDGDDDEGDDDGEVQVVLMDSDDHADDNSYSSGKHIWYFIL